MIVWKTGHQIADTVADALARGFHGDLQEVRAYTPRAGDVCIGYGILRGNGEAFKAASRQFIPWFNCDRGYWLPNHFDGYYRISYKGTQAKWHEDAPLKPFDIALLPRIQRKDWAMICPPTDAVCDFFGIDKEAWMYEHTRKAHHAGYMVMVRDKDCVIPLEQHLQDVGLVITFNSSVGWKAVQMGIPCLSDVNHSVVGSYYGETVIENLLNAFYTKPREELFYFMRAHDFTLHEIAEGKAWEIVNHYKFSSDMIAGKLSALMSPPTASISEPKQKLTLAT